MSNRVMQELKTGADDSDDLHRALELGCCSGVYIPGKHEEGPAKDILGLGIELLGNQLTRITTAIQPALPPGVWWR